MLSRLPLLLRSAFGLTLFSAWLALFFAGLDGGGAVHLLLAAALVLFPWQSLRG